MAEIVIADSTGRYDGRSLEIDPLGATESSVIRLARELARRGHRVTVLCPCAGALEHEGVSWRPLGQGAPAACDAFVAVQHAALLGLVPRARRRALWQLWQPCHLEHYTRILAMLRHRPIPILASRHQLAIWAPLPPHPDLDRPHGLAPGLGPAERWIAPLRKPLPIRNLRRLAEVWVGSLLLPRPGPRHVIPLALPEEVRGRLPLPAAPPRRAIFASNPARNLKRLVEIWAEAILPQVPDAVLDVYGVHDLGDRDAWQVWAGSRLPAALPPAARASVRIHPTAPRPALVEALRQARVMLYLGHECEAFCMVLAEAQALGLPAVIAPVAALPERVIDGVTGFHAADPGDFARRAAALLTDEALWRRQHEAALVLSQGIGWPEFAARFEGLLLEPDRLKPDRLET